MSTWDLIKPIFDALPMIIKANVPALKDQVYAFLSSSMIVQVNPDNAALKRVIMGRSSPDDLCFPQVNIVPVNDKRDPITIESEDHNLYFKIVTLQKDEASTWGAHLKVLQLTYDVADALYARMGTANTRTLGGVCNDVFVEDSQFDTEPMKGTFLHWNFTTVRVVKKINTKKLS